MALALLGVVLAWQLWPSPTAGAIIVAALFALPILAPLLGLWRGQQRTYRWATLCVLPYFIVGLTEVIATPATRAWSATIVALAFGWFVALIGFLRVSVVGQR